MVVLNVVVAGGGIAGLTCAASLRSIGAHVIVLESKSRDMTNYCGNYLGLWSPSMRALSVLSCHRDITASSFAVSKSGYRSVDGSPSLSFIKENILYGHLLETTIGDINYNEIVEDILHDGRSSIVKSKCTLTKKEIHRPVDLIIVADGMRSGFFVVILEATSTILMEGYLRIRFKRGVLAQDSPVYQPNSSSRSNYITDGNAWFAAITSPLPSLSSVSSVPSVSMSLSELSGRFAHWHDPIPRLLAATDAYPVDMDNDHNFSHAVGNGNERYVQGVEAWAFNRCVSVSHAIAFVGDAAHTLDPILAQALKAALETFERSRAHRVRNLHTLSTIAQMIGHMDSQMMCNIRDIGISSLPHYLKGHLFDRLINLSVTAHPLLGFNYEPSNPLYDDMH
eukprot:gene7107-14455_t